MTSMQLYRLSGLALLIGMLLSTFCAMLSTALFPDSNCVSAAINPLNLLLGVVAVVGTVLGLFGLPGMYARAARGGGLAWLIGVILIAITAALRGVPGSREPGDFPVLATQPPDLFSQ